MAADRPVVPGSSVAPAPDDPRVELCAAGEAAWHAAAHAGLGIGWHAGRTIALAERAAHPFLLTAVTLVPRPDPAELAVVAPGEMLDSWASFVGSAPAGWAEAPADPWMFRPPSPCPPPRVDGLTVVATEDALLFERTAFLSASGSPPRRPGELHPAGSADYPGMHLFLALLDGAAEPVGTAIAVVHPRGVVVSGVAVLAAARGRGIGAALTSAAVSTAPGVPATLSASALGASVYRRLGFAGVGRPLHWRIAG